MQDEWEFNRRAGFTAADNDLPEWMRTEPVPSNEAVYDATPETLERVYEANYDESILRIRATG